jgi:hypothetical protein
MEGTGETDKIPPSLSKRCTGDTASVIAAHHSSDVGIATNCRIRIIGCPFRIEPPIGPALHRL